MRREPRTKTGLLALLLAAACATSAGAHPCGAEAFDTALGQLESDGWTVAETLTDAQRENLAWTRAITYITGDDGGLTPAQVLDLQRAAAPGLLRRVDTATTRSRVLVRGDEAMTLTETVTAPGLTERRCRIATAAPAGAPRIDTTGWPGAPVLADLILVQGKAP